MTLDDIGKRLKAEFPNRYVSFVAEVAVCQGAEVCRELRFYTTQTGRIGGFDTLNQGIALLKSKLGMVSCDGDFNVAVGEAPDVAVGEAPDAEPEKLEGVA